MAMKEKIQFQTFMKQKEKKKAFNAGKSNIKFRARKYWKYIKMSEVDMVLILEGNSKHVAHLK